jgi:superfamily II DNA or RNA helicase
MMLFQDEVVEAAQPAARLVPRDYQTKACDESFRLWDEGAAGVLMRIFTGGGKTPLACMEISRWLGRGPDHHAMIVSYEKQLVSQFAQEVEDFLGIRPGVEMGEEYVDPTCVPKVVVASRQTLLRAKEPTAEQVEAMRGFGIADPGAINQKLAQRLLKMLVRGVAVDEVREELARLNTLPLACGKHWSRLHKFSWQWPWLVIYDEAHRHSHRLQSVGHIVDWFEKNPASKRGGLTATPKRGDGVSIGHKMFPAVAIDYPLYHATKPCALRSGWAVPYEQCYIEVEGVDFKNIAKVKGDFCEEELEAVLGEEGTLAKLVQPLLDMVGDRRTLIFSPGVAMAANVARFINARSKVECPACRKTRWYPVKLLGDGAECPCGQKLTAAGSSGPAEQAKSIHGGTPPGERQKVYESHQDGEFQFLSVCGLCREGYNDPDISCVAVFRPVSRAASSLAEQMKGRGCRPCRSIVHALNSMTDPEERVAAIAASPKPKCRIVDLVGISGLADCASTVQIYADGLPDEVVMRAEAALEAAAASSQTVDVQELVERLRETFEEEQRLAEERRQKRAKAKSDAEDLRKKVAAARRDREEQDRAANRAQADAQVQYTTHEVGFGSAVKTKTGATDRQMKFIAALGMKILKEISVSQARRIITMLRQRLDPGHVAYKNRIQEGEWQETGPSEAQMKLLRWHNAADDAKTRCDAGLLITAIKDPARFEQEKMAKINGSADSDYLTAEAMDVKLVRKYLPTAV